MGQDKKGLPVDLRAGLEQLSGVDLSDVKVHYNSLAPAKLGTQSFTQGPVIHLSPGQEKHLAHEVAHILQQRGGQSDGGPVMVGLDAKTLAEGQRLQARAEAAAKKQSGQN